MINPFETCGRRGIIKPSLGVIEKEQWEFYNRNDGKNSSSAPRNNICFEIWFQDFSWVIGYTNVTVEEQILWTKQEVKDKYKGDITRRRRDANGIIQKWALSANIYIINMFTNNFRRGKINRRGR